MSDMSLFRRFYEPNLAVVNVDGVNVMGPEDAAFAVNSLLKPTSVIVSHAEQAVTTNGQMNRIRELPYSHRWSTTRLSTCR